LVVGRAGLGVDIDSYFGLDTLVSS